MLFAYTAGESRQHPRLVDCLDLGFQIADGKMIGQTLVTKQTGEEGKRVNKVMVGEAVEIDRELYLAILMDRERTPPLYFAYVIAWLRLYGPLDPFPAEPDDFPDYQSMRPFELIE